MPDKRQQTASRKESGAPPRGHTAEGRIQPTAAGSAASLVGGVQDVLQDLLNLAVGDAGAAAKKVLKRYEVWLEFTAAGVVLDAITGATAESFRKALAAGLTSLQPDPNSPSRLSLLSPLPPANGELRLALATVPKQPAATTPASGGRTKRSRKAVDKSTRLHQNSFESDGIDERRGLVRGKVKQEVGPETAADRGLERRKKKPDLPDIELSEVEKASAEVQRLRKPIVERIQRLVQNLQGRSGKTPAINVKIADTVRAMAKSNGIELVSKNRKSYLRWHKGVFEAQTTDSTRKVIDSDEGFVPLTVRVPDHDQPTGEPAEHAARIRRNRADRTAGRS